MLILTSIILAIPPSFLSSANVISMLLRLHPSFLMKTHCVFLKKSFHLLDFGPIFDNFVKQSKSRRIWAMKLNLIPKQHNESKYVLQNWARPQCDPHSGPVNVVFWTKLTIKLDKCLLMRMMILDSQTEWYRGKQTHWIDFSVWRQFPAGTTQSAGRVCHWMTN